MTLRAESVLSDFQKKKVRNVVSEYCNSISEYVSSRDAAESNARIFQLINNSWIRIFDDLSMKPQQDINAYLIGLRPYIGKVKFYFKENIENVEVTGLSNPNLSKSSEIAKYGEIGLTKIIEKNGQKRTVKNVFVVDLENFKIVTITNERNISPFDLWLAGVKAYNKKNYKEAFKNYKKCADLQKNDNYVALAQYSVAVMQIKGRGCRKNFKQAINYLKKSSKQGHPDAYQLLLHFDVY